MSHRYIGDTNLTSHSLNSRTKKCYNNFKLLIFMRFQQQKKVNLKNVQKNRFTLFSTPYGTRTGSVESIEFVVCGVRL